MRPKFLLIICYLVGMTAFSQTKYVAHRGASYIAPENTLASITLAWELDSYAAECDIMLSRDGQVVVFHDSNTRRLTGKDHVVSETDYATLKSLDIDLRASNSSHFKGQKIPLLKDLLESLPEGRLLVIEIKTGKEILPALEKDIKSYWKTGKIAFISFGYEAIRETKKLFPEVPAYYLSGSKKDVMDKLEDIKRDRLDGVDMNYKAIDQELVDIFHEEKLGVWCYTINDVENAKKMEQMGVDAITTDRPYFLRELVQNK